jgi:lipoate---protein ligase
MFIFYRPFTDPYLNLAAEEYFVKHATKDMCMIWINDKSVIIGKHQNAYAEINYPFVSSKKIPVIRRISGGGAVYHDCGNVNFTFIKKSDKINPVNFGQFTSIIIEFIQCLGIEVNVNKRNSLFTGNYKFSGHAEHVFHDRVLHHGTILFNTDLELLQHCLYPGKGYHGKAMASARSEVANIASLLSVDLTIHQFINMLIDWLKKYFPESTTYEMNKHELDAIVELSETKYKSWIWNFGYSPPYSFQVAIHAAHEPVSATIKVENGKIVQIDFLPEKIKGPVEDILSTMAGILHKEEEINNFARNNAVGLELAGVKLVNFSNSFFK